MQTMKYCEIYDGWLESVLSSGLGLEWCKAIGGVERDMHAWWVICESCFSWCLQQLGSRVWSLQPIYCGVDGIILGTVCDQYNLYHIACCMGLYCFTILWIEHLNSVSYYIDMSDRVSCRALYLISYCIAVCHWIMLLKVYITLQDMCY